MTLNEAFEILKKEGVTSHIDSVRRWIRQGKLKATLLSKREGYRVELSDLLEFMKTKLPQERYEEVKTKFQGDQQKTELSEEILNKATYILMEEKIKQLIQEYEEKLKEIEEDGYDGCYDCCDYTIISVNKVCIAEFVKQLRTII